MFSLFLRERLYIGEACWAFLFGVIIGPYCANIFNPRDWGGGSDTITNTITLEFTRVVLAIGVFAIGVELPKAYMARHWKSLFFLLFPVMTWGWFVSAGLIYALIPGLNFLSSLAVAACLTPTDPILAAAVVGGKYADKHVPAHLRHLLAAESACNDGAAFPFLFLALYLITAPSVGRAIYEWFVYLWLYQVILGIVLGAVLGFAFRHLMKFCERKDLIDRQSYVAQYVSLALLTIGANTLLGSDDLLAAFSCGTAFAWDGFFNKQTEESVFSSVIDLLFNVAAFVYVGAWMPFDAFTDASLTLNVWRLIVIAILVLLLRRLPIMIALYRWIPDIKTLREAVFSGHFGPMGIGAVFISTLAAQQLPQPSSPPQGQQEMLAASIQPIVAFMVLCSITIHGLSIPFFSLGRRVHSVSRTWSRHDTFGTFNGRGLPEWTTHTRHVRAGEDIVINRDSEMERGTLSPQEKERRRGSPSEMLAGEGSTTLEEKDERESEQIQDEEATRADGSDMRQQNKPDGDEIISEWKEGTHRIVEKRAGPGEEVEVEVHENAYGPQETATNTIRVAQDSASEVVRDIAERIRRAPQDLGSVLERAQEAVQEEAEDVPSKAKGIQHRAQHKAQHKTKQAKNAMNIRDDDMEEEEEEGWMSDASNGAEHASTSTDGKRRPRSPKQRGTKPPPSRPGGSGRRRISIRRGLLGPRSLLRSQSEDVVAVRRDSDEERGSDTASEIADEHRGRRVPHANSVSHGPSSLRSPRHARIDSLRTLDSHSRGSRELSPARSVRFADTTERSSGYTTPRIFSPSSPATPLSAMTPLPGSEAPSGDEQQADNDSPRNQVRFSLPSPADKRA
ncbi:hypothetical protein AcV5_007692 [Taiwanofungus camphoratus]|nr:hypothetical protein AcV5_007692 [Antrodia cinnamomea]